LEGSEDKHTYSIYAKFRNIFGETQPVSDSILFLSPVNLWINEYDITLIIICLGGLGLVILMVKKGR